jgi:hypothetical protein
MQLQVRNDDHVEDHVHKKSESPLKHDNRKKSQDDALNAGVSCCRSINGNNAPQRRPGYQVQCPPPALEAMDQ